MLNRTCNRGQIWVLTLGVLAMAVPATSALAQGRSPRNANGGFRNQSAQPDWQRNWYQPDQRPNQLDRRVAQPRRGGRDRGFDRAEADIEELEARMYLDRGVWRLNVAFEVEAEDARPGQFDLVVQLREKGRRILDRRGRPIEFIVPLNRPVKIKRDEAEFRGNFSATISLDAIGRAKNVRVEAIVIDRSTGRAVEQDDAKVEVSSRNRGCGRPY